MEGSCFGIVADHGDFHGDQSEVALILEAYGWLPPIDDPKLGFGRGNLYHRDAMVRLAGYMGIPVRENDILSVNCLSYLQAISKLSNYLFVVDLQRHNSDSCI